MGGTDWQNLAFFAFNAVFTIFNARIAWQSWRREESKALPQVRIVTRMGEPDIMILELHYAGSELAVWRPVSARLLRPRKGKITSPLAHYRVNELNEPWVPEPIEIHWEATGRECRLYVSAVPGREEVWVQVPPKRRRTTLSVALDFESNEPQPRRHTMKVKRAIAPLNPVITN